MKYKSKTKVMKSLVEDSNFPFKVGEPLIIRIDGDRLVIEREWSHERKAERDED